MSGTDFQRQLHGSEQHFKRRRSISEMLHIDLTMLIIILAIGSFGIVVLYSASGENMAMVNRQLTRFAMGLVAMFIVAQIPSRLYARWSPWLYFGGILLLLLVLVIGRGQSVNRWLDLPGIPRFQPSELLKLGLPMGVAWYLAEREKPPSLKHVMITLLAIAVPVLLVAKQPDLGTSLLIAAGGLLVLFLAGLSWRLVTGALVATPLMGVALWFGMKPYQKQRVLTLLDPEADAQGAGWNIIQSKTAIGSGGIEGKGWLNGTQSQLDFLPESHTDFILAVLAEEFGLIGVCLLLLAYIALVMRCAWIAINAQNNYARLLAGSLSFTFFVYVFVNMGMVSGILPVVGMPLPLVSYGGTSIVTLLAGMGMIMSVQTHRTLISR